MKSETLKDGYLSIPIYDKDGDFEDLILESEYAYGIVTDGSLIGRFQFQPTMTVNHIHQFYGIQYILTELTRATGLIWEIKGDGFDEITGETLAIAIVHYNDNE